MSGRKNHSISSLRAFRFVGLEISIDNLRRTRKRYSLGSFGMVDCVLRCVKAMMSNYFQKLVYGHRSPQL